MTEETFVFTVSPEEAGRRLDAFVADRYPDLTRSQVERLAKGGSVLVDGVSAMPGRSLAAGEKVEVRITRRSTREPQPENIPLDIVFEDNAVIVINKPRGLVVHPGAGRERGTLVNALLAHTSQLAVGGGSHRPGIVHRLDRNTSGLLVVAKTQESYVSLSQQVRRREVDRRYTALIWGDVDVDCLTIDVPIGRHTRDRKRMAAVRQSDEGRKVRSARTDIDIVERFGTITLVGVKLSTGRTHQIRVHLAHIGHPIVGDPTYGIRVAKQRRAALDLEKRRAVQSLQGQALHAHALRFLHPQSGQKLSFSVPLPADMEGLLALLRRKTESKRPR